MCFFVFFARGMAGSSADKIFLEDGKNRPGNITCRSTWQLFHLSDTEPGFPNTDGFADAKRGHYCDDPWLDVFERVYNSKDLYCCGGYTCRDICNEAGFP